MVACSYVRSLVFCVCCGKLLIHLLCIFLYNAGVSPQHSGSLLFSNLVDEVRCINADLCLGMAGFKALGGPNNGGPFVLYRGSLNVRSGTVLARGSDEL